MDLSSSFTGYIYSCSKTVSQLSPNVIVFNVLKLCVVFSKGHYHDNGFEKTKSKRYFCLNYNLHVKAVVSFDRI